MMLVLTYSWHMSLESHRRILTLIVDCIGTEKPDKFSPILCPLPEIDDEIDAAVENHQEMTLCRELLLSKLRKIR